MRRLRPFSTIPQTTIRSRWSDKRSRRRRHRLRRDALSGALGRDTLNGGRGIDTVTFASSAKAVNASLITGFARRLGTIPLEGVALVSVENLKGTSLADTLTGSAVKNELVGGSGADRMFGLAGNDALNSRDGVNGNDALDGGAGTDSCTTDAREASERSCP